MLLVKAQAEAVYSAMVVLNNIGGKIDALFPLSYTAGQVHVFESILDGEIHVRHINGDVLNECPREVYGSQNAFAEAYSLN